MDERDTKIVAIAVGAYLIYTYKNELSEYWNNVFKHASSKSLKSTTQLAAGNKALAYGKNKDVYAAMAGIQRNKQLHIRAV